MTNIRMHMHCDCILRQARAWHDDTHWQYTQLALHALQAKGGQVPVWFQVDGVANPQAVQETIDTCTNKSLIAILERLLRYITKQTSDEKLKVHVHGCHACMPPAGSELPRRLLVSECTL